jgi:hypothetical protein
MEQMLQRDYSSLGIDHVMLAKERPSKNQEIQ